MGVLFPYLWVVPARKTIGVWVFSTSGKLMCAAKSSFYGIVGGLNGFSGVAVDWWTQAHRLTDKVSGVKHKRFNSEQEAREFVSKHTGQQASSVEVLKPNHYNYSDPNSGEETEWEEQGGEEYALQQALQQTEEQKNAEVDETIVQSLRLVLQVIKKNIEEGQDGGWTLPELIEAFDIDVEDTESEKCKLLYKELSALPAGTLKRLLG